MNQVVYQNILSEICSAIREIPEDGTIEKNMIKILAEKMILDTMPNEEQMNDTFRLINDRNGILRRKRAIQAEEANSAIIENSSVKVLSMKKEA